MTREEAIEWMEVKRSTVIEVPDRPQGARELIQAYDLAIEALKAEPVKHGKWQDGISCQVDEDAYHVANCSECKAEITIDPNYDDYCPHCGAKMDKR